MKDLTISQEYFICAVNEKGILSSSNAKAVACLVASGLFEMQLEECIRIDDKKISVCAELPNNLYYLKPLYDIINQPKPIKIETIVKTHAFSLGDKKLQELINSITIALKEKNMVVPVKVGLFGTKENYAPKKEIVKNVIEKIRSELLENGEVSEDVIILTSLLDKAGLLKEYFSKFEQQELCSRLDEIRNSESGIIVKQMITHIDMLMASLIVSDIICLLS